MPDHYGEKKPDVKNALKRRTKFFVEMDDRSKPEAKKMAKATKDK